LPIAIEALLTARALGALSREDLERTREAWSVVTLPAGETVWTEGQPVEAIAVVEAGELALTANGVEVGVARAGDAALEPAVFLGHGNATTTARTQKTTRLLLLSVVGIQDVRALAPAAYDGLLEIALVAQATRLSSARLSVARTGGEGPLPAPRRAAPTALGNLWRVLSGSGATLRPGAAPSLGPLLRALPPLDTADSGTLERIGACFKAEYLEPGDLAFLEGEQRTTGWIVAEGEIELLRNVRGERAERLEFLGPGTFFGEVALVQPGTRTASAVATRPTWLFRAEPARLLGLDGDAWLAWREVLLSALTRQVTSAEAAFARQVEASSARLDRAPAPGTRPLLVALRNLEAQPAAEEPSVNTTRFREILRDSGWADATLEGLDQIEVVYGNRRAARAG